MAYFLEGLEYLAASIVMLAIWAAAYAFCPRERKEMLFASLLSAPLGLLEPLYVPSYWNPPTLLGLYSKIGLGFDVEALIFCFAAGGVAASLYAIVFPLKRVRMGRRERAAQSFHKLSLAAGPVAFAVFALIGKWNIIYSTIAAIFIGGAGVLLCRPDLARKMAVGAVFVLAFYFLSFLAFNAAFPGYTLRVWNLGDISGILVLGVPLEELFFALSVGFLWSGLYEHLNGYRIADGK